MIMSTTASETYRLGMRRLASGVSIVTTVEGERPHSLVATAVTSVTANPWTLLVCVNRRASIYLPLRTNGRFCVNVLSENQAELTRVFSDTDQRDTRFDHGEWRTVLGVPVLRDSEVAFICNVSEQVEVGSHDVFFGQIQEVLEIETTTNPLIWYDGACRELASKKLLTGE